MILRKLKSEDVICLIKNLSKVIKISDKVNLRVDCVSLEELVKIPEWKSILSLFISRSKRKDDRFLGIWLESLDPRKDHAIRNSGETYFNLEVFNSHSLESRSLSINPMAVRNTLERAGIPWQQDFQRRSCL